MSLSTYIRQPELLDAATIDELSALVERYPYFQAARLLLLRGLYQLQSDRFGVELRRAALFVPDRARLFELIEGEHFKSSPEQQPTQTIATSAAAPSTASSPADRTQSLIDSFLQQQPEEPKPRRTRAVDATTDYIGYLLQMEDASSATPTLDIAPLLEKKRPEGDPVPGPSSTPTETASTEFSESPVEAPADEQLESTAESPSEAPTKTTTETTTRTTGTTTGTPAETPAGSTAESVSVSEDELPPLGLDESDENVPSEAYFTETLARIYIKQGKYGKAIEIIRRLNLNYPKKSRYFADQIRFLEKLLINEQSK